jgi:hypothetical protein
MKKGIFHKGICILTIAIIAGCVTTLQDYKPENENEAAIKQTLLQWETSWNNHNVEKHLFLWNANASIMYGTDRKIASKEEYIDILPERMKANPELHLGAPKISIKGKDAYVKTSIKIGQRTTPVTFHMIKDANGWSFIGWEY